MSLYHINVANFPPEKTIFSCIREQPGGFILANNPEKEKH